MWKSQRIGNIQKKDKVKLDKLLSRMGDEGKYRDLSPQQRDSLIERAQKTGRVKDIDRQRMTINRLFGEGLTEKVLEEKRELEKYLKRKKAELELRNKLNKESKIRE